MAKKHSKDSMSTKKYVSDKPVRIAHGSKVKRVGRGLVFPQRPIPPVTIPFSSKRVPKVPHPM